MRLKIGLSIFFYVAFCYAHSQIFFDTNTWKNYKQVSEKGDTLIGISNLNSLREYGKREVIILYTKNGYWNVHRCLYDRDSKKWKNISKSKLWYTETRFIRNNFKQIESVIVESFNVKGVSSDPKYVELSLYIPDVIEINDMYIHGDVNSFLDTNKEILFQLYSLGVNCIRN